jgi:hypothetical protein
LCPAKGAGAELRIPGCGSNWKVLIKASENKDLRQSYVHTDEII